MNVSLPSRAASPSVRFRRLSAPLAALTLVSLVSWSSAVADEKYSLDVPGNAALHSVASRTENALTITDSAGRVHLYVRAPRLDTRDGRFIGFFSEGAQQTVRWPSTGIGRFLIGDARGIQFRESQMTITPIVPPAIGPAVRDALRPVVPPLPGRDPNFNRNPNPDVGRGPLLFPQQPQQQPGEQAFRRFREPVEVALLHGADESLTAAYIDDEGQLHLYSGWQQQWRPLKAPLRERLMAGAPVALVADANGGLPAAFTVSARGDLLEILDGQRTRSLSDRSAFVPGTHLVSTGSPRFPSLAAVDVRGRIWDISLGEGRSRPIEANFDRYAPGIPLASVDLGGSQELFLIDRRGTLVNYRGVRGRWEGPDPIARGFSPGGHVAATLLPNGVNAELLVSSVDATGQLRNFRLAGNGWADVPLGQISLPPGAAVGVARAADGIHVSGVTRNGIWVDWSQQRVGALTPREIGRGFPAGAPVTFAVHDDHMHAACVDAGGRLVAATVVNHQWDSVLLVPGFDRSPRLVRRVVEPAAALPTVTVQFSNSSNEELLVKVLDELSPSAPIEFRIPPGRSVPQELKRDPGGIIEEVWLVPGPGGILVEDVRRTPLPSPPRYRVVAYANRTTYSYVDRRAKPGPLKDFDMQTPVSLGTFRLPPGADLRDGDAFDVAREAIVRQNPGAAAIVDPFGP